MAKLPTSFIQRNHVYEVPQVGYHRTIPIEAIDDNTFKDKKNGIKGWLMLEPNCKILISIAIFLDNGMIGAFVEKYDAYGKPREPYGILITRDDFLQAIQKPEKY